MEAAYVVVLIIGFVLFVIWAVDQHLTLEALRLDLEEYVETCADIATVVDEPRVKIHYKAVASVLSGMLSKYFPEND